MDASPVRPIFSDTTLGAEEPQRPFRVSGLLSLLFGILSIGALASGSMLFLPAFALICALIAFRPARDPRAIPAGRTLAVAGATLALFFAGWAVAQQTVRTRYMAAEGERLARNWLAVLADGQREFAFELTLPSGARQLESMSLVQFYQNNEKGISRLQSFLEQPPVKAILAADEPPDWELVKVVGLTRFRAVERITLQFRDRSGQISEPVDVIMTRNIPYPNSEGETADEAVQWHVDQIGFGI